MPTVYRCRELICPSRSGNRCQRSSEASRDSMVSDRPKVIEMAIRDLDDYLTLFPEQMQAREIRDALRASKAERPSAWVIGGAIGAI